NDNGHDAAGEYMEKGSSNPSLGSFAAEAENYFAESPLGVLFDQDVELGTREISVTNVNELLGEGSGDSIIDRSKLNPDNRKFGNLLKKVIGNSGIFEQIKKELEEKDDPDRWDAVVTSFKSGGANHAKLSLEDQDLDSHSAHPQNHMRELSAAYSEIAKGLKKFKETPYKDGSLFDHTTFYVFSEFSRTPFLNGANGKDHNPRTNSALVLGKGIIGGKAVGASRLVTTDESAVGVPYHMGMPLDFSTELPTMNRSVAEFIHPEVVIKTLAMAIGMGNGADDLYGRDTRFLKSLLK
ncbi:MAG: DUF1501 domain-containing protein, partial [Bdellovibrionales bacterium]|nr:DUF1501 domain-containing protein [Bdellovibrionales bacterium]